jgi:hypothetical protein
MPSHLVVFLDFRTSRNSSVDIAMGLRVGVKIPESATFFAFPMRPRPTLAPTQPSLLLVQRGDFPGVKRSGRKAQHSPPCNFDVTTTAYIFMV